VLTKGFFFASPDAVEQVLKERRPPISRCSKLAICGYNRQNSTNVIVLLYAGMAFVSDAKGSQTAPKGRCHANYVR
jgi:hypothetical protein